MSARILLVTGSRAFDHSACEAQARAVLVAYATAFSPSLVVTGDACGPDAWAAEWAVATPGVGLRVYSLDGGVYDERAVRLRFWVAPKASAHRLLPLQRNEAMVWETAQQIAKGATVRVLALYAAWSKTSGTLDTLAHASMYGLTKVDVRFEEAER